LERAPLPVALTSFIGRERELAALSERLLDPRTRLLTLTGPGGSGKTRLAVEVARTVEAAFADGAAFVALAALTDPALVLPTILQALGLRELAGRSPLETLQAALTDKHLLLVLDNCEQVTAAAPRVATLLAGAPGLRVLAMSRARLAVGGERVQPVNPLRLPSPAEAADPAALQRVEAVWLFTERAQDARPDFTLDAGNAATVGAICARLDGLPLAIELAATWSRHLAPAALLTRLESNLALLTGGPRDLPQRQQTLQATIAWSHALLDEQGQAPRAARLGGAAAALREALGIPLSPLQPHLRADHELAMQALRAALGEEVFAAAWAAGRALPLEEAVAQALEGASRCRRGSSRPGLSGSIRPRHRAPASRVRLTR
jgi:predicted ATPase